MKVLIFNPRSINCSRAGGAEIYLHEILSRVKECEFLIISSSDRKSRYQHLSYTENIVARSEYLFPIFSAKYAKHIRNFDIIIESVSKFPIIWPLLLSKLLSKPFIAIAYHIHGRTLFRELPFPIALMFYIYEMLSLKLYSLLGAFVITISTSTKRELLRLGFSKHKILIVHPGLNPKMAVSCNTSKAKEPFLVYVGRVKKYKRLDHLIKAMVIVKQKVPNAKCVIAGKDDNDLYKKLRSLAERLGLKESVLFEGGVNEERKFELMRKAWVFVNPSMKEGFSIASLEAQACGTPVVGYRISGLVDCVKNNITGLLVPDGDWKALAEAITNLLLNEELRLKMSKNAMLHGSSFDQKTSAKKFLIFLNKVIRCQTCIS
jgi:glycosyltransferase involved in cell wall biosynthesis